MNDSNKPLVSVIIPIYKVEKYITDCLNSVLAQTYGNIEIVLVDDGSPDRSMEIAEQLLNDKGVSYVPVRQENMGLGEARNSGLRVATGEWIYFLDSDDMIVDATIEKLVSATETDTDFVFSGYRVIRNADESIASCGDEKSVIYDAEEIRKEFLMRKKIVLAPGTLYRKSFLDNNDLKFASIPWSEDQHFMFRVLQAAKKIAYIKEPLYLYLEREGSIMRATPAEKVLIGYNAIENLAKDVLTDKTFKKFVTARWVMGTLNSTARTYDYDEWKNLYKDLDGKKRLKRLLRFPDLKVKALAFLGIISPRLYYKANKR